MAGPPFPMDICPRGVLRLFILYGKGWCRNVLLPLLPYPKSRRSCSGHDNGEVPCFPDSRCGHELRKKSFSTAWVLSARHRRAEGKGRARTFGGVGALEYQFSKTNQQCHLRSGVISRTYVRLPESYAIFQLQVHTRSKKSATRIRIEPSALLVRKAAAAAGSEVVRSGASDQSCSRGMYELTGRGLFC